MNTRALVDGRIVSTSSEEWRDECLARHVLALASKPDRQAWLAGFEQRHGAAAAERLRYVILAVHEVSARQPASMGDAR